MSINIKDSGDRTKFITGAVRDRQEGKGRMDLLPFRALLQVSKIFEAGANKYGDRNWSKGMPLSRFIDSGLRHLAKHMNGERDEYHIAQCVWNFLCYLETEEMIKEGIIPAELNDIPHNDLEINNDSV